MSFVIVFLTLYLSVICKCCLHDHVGVIDLPPLDDNSFWTTPKPNHLRTAIINVQPFDGYQILPRQTVFIKDGTIVPYISHVDVTVDGNGGVLLPGLIDSHCHPDTPSDLGQLSSYGVTTVIGATCGNYTHCHLMKEQSGVADYIFAGQAAQGPNSPPVPGLPIFTGDYVDAPWQAQSFADRVFGNGSDFLKIIAKANSLTLDTQIALVDAAHKHGRQTLTHAAELDNFEMAILSKTDSLQHAPRDGVLNSTMVDLMVTQGQFVTPTMEVARLLLILAQINPEIGRNFGLGPNSTYEHYRDNVALMHNAGVPVLAGSDSANYPGLNVSTFGWSLQVELDNLVDAGLSNCEALRSATLKPAQLHGLVDRGKIEAGLRADLVLLEPGANPLEDIKNSRRIAKVWNGGIEYDSLGSQLVYLSPFAISRPAK